MKRLQCEACGSNDIVKIADDMFQCQFCGCKYTLETVRSLVVDGEVKVKATDFEIVGGKLVKYNGESTEVVIPDKVTVIGERAFKDCTGITKVVIPSSVMTIEVYAFEKCRALKEVVIPDSVTSIGGYCFLDCSSLQEIVIPDSVTSIGIFCFKKCGSLRSIRLSCNIEQLNMNIFEECLSLEELIIPEGVKQLSFNNGYYRSSLKSNIKKMTFPYSLVSVEGWPQQSLESVEGNSAVLLNNVNINNLFDYSGRSVFLENYKQQIRDDRRARGVCVICGGQFEGVFKKVCRNCHTIKSY